MANVEFTINTGTSRTKIQQLTKSVDDFRKALVRARRSAQGLNRTLLAPVTSGAAPTLGNVVSGKVSGGGVVIAGTPKPRSGQPRPRAPILPGFARAIPTVAGLAGVFAALRGLSNEFLAVGEAGRQLTGVLKGQEAALDTFRRNVFGPGSPFTERQMRDISRQTRLPLAQAAEVTASVISATAPDKQFALDLIRKAAPIIASLPPKEGAELLGGMGDLRRAAASMQLSVEEAGGIIAGAVRRARPPDVGPAKTELPLFVTQQITRANLIGQDLGEAIQEASFIWEEFTKQLGDVEARITTGGLIRLSQRINESALRNMAGIRGESFINQMRFLQANPRLAQFFFGELKGGLEAKFRPAVEALLLDPQSSIAKAITGGLELLSEKDYRQQLKQDFADEIDAIDQGIEKVVQNISRSIQTALEEQASRIIPSRAILDEEDETRLKTLLVEAQRGAGTTPFGTGVDVFFTKNVAGGLGAGITLDEQRKLIERTRRGIAIEAYNQYRPDFSPQIFSAVEAEQALRELQSPEAREAIRQIDILDRQAKNIALEIEKGEITREFDQAVERVSKIQGQSPELFGERVENLRKQALRERERIREQQRDLLAPEVNIPSLDSQPPSKDLSAAQLEAARRTAAAAEALANRPRSINGETD